MMDMKAISPIDFEKLTQTVLNSMGLVAELTKKTGDGGIDIIAYNKQPVIGGKYIIQCKRYNGSVGEPIIRDLYGVVCSERANKGILISTGTFTQSAKKFALDKQIELIDGHDFEQLLLSNDIDGLKTSDSLDWTSFAKEYEILNNEIRNDSDNYKLREKLIGHYFTEIFTLPHVNKKVTTEQFHVLVNKCIDEILYFGKYKSLDCNYYMNFNLSELYILKGDLCSAFKCLSNIITILDTKGLDYWCQESANNDSLRPTLSILAPIFNYLQICNILKLNMKFEGVFEKGNNLFKLRLQQLDELINDDSLDWADPEENIEDILEFMEEEKLKYEYEKESLLSMKRVSFFYLLPRNITMYNPQIVEISGANYVDPFGCDDNEILLSQIAQDNEIPFGIDSFPHWGNTNFAEIIRKANVLLG